MTILRKKWLPCCLIVCNSSYHCSHPLRLPSGSSMNSVIRLLPIEPLFSFCTQSGRSIKENQVQGDKRGKDGSTLESKSDEKSMQHLTSSTTGAVADGISKIRPQVLQILESGYLRSINELSTKIIQETWEGHSPLRDSELSFKKAAQWDKRPSSESNKGGNNGKGESQTHHHPSDRKGSLNNGSTSFSDRSKSEYKSEIGGVPILSYDTTGRNRAIRVGLARFENSVAEEEEKQEENISLLKYEIITQLYNDPQNLDIIPSERLKKKARAIIHLAVEERYAEIEVRATNLAKEVIQQSTGTGDLLGGGGAATKGIAAGWIAAFASIVWHPLKRIWYGKKPM